MDSYALFLANGDFVAANEELVVTAIKTLREVGSGAQDDLDATVAAFAASTGLSPGDPEDRRYATRSGLRRGRVPGREARRLRAGACRRFLCAWDRPDEGGHPGRRLDARGAGVTPAASARRARPAPVRPIADDGSRRRRMIATDLTAPRARPPARHRLPDWRDFLPFALPVALLLAWEVASIAGIVSDRILPRPSAVLVTGWEKLLSGELLEHLGVSGAARAGGPRASGGSIGFAAGPRERLVAQRRARDRHDASDDPQHPEPGADPAGHRLVRHRRGGEAVPRRRCRSSFRSISTPITASATSTRS